MLLSSYSNQTSLHSSDHKYLNKIHITDDNFSHFLVNNFTTSSNFLKKKKKKSFIGIESRNGDFLQRGEPVANAVPNLREAQAALAAANVRTSAKGAKIEVVEA